MTPPQQAAQLALDLSDVVHDVSRRAARRVRNHLLFILDREDPTALELLDTYAPLPLQLARGGQDDVEVIALSVVDGLTLLRAPQHDPTILRELADQIAADDLDAVIGVCVARGGFARFNLRRTEVH